jgi:hypothetical protein
LLAASLPETRSREGYTRKYLFEGPHTCTPQRGPNNLETRRATNKEIDKCNDKKTVVVVAASSNVPTSITDTKEGTHRFAVRRIR